MMKPIAAALGLSLAVVVGSVLWGTAGEGTGKECPVAKAVSMAGGCCGDAVDPASAQKTCDSSEACPLKKTAAKEASVGKPCSGDKGSCGAAEQVTETRVPAQPVSLQEKPEKKEPKIQCPVMGGTAKKTIATEYLAGKVFFCCPDCIEEFKKNTAKYQTKANLQLVLTKQYVQKACPLSGRPTSADQKLTVAGVTVHFCCNHCLTKVHSLSEAEALSTVFGKTGFDKAFEPQKKEKEEAKKG